MARGEPDRIIIAEPHRAGGILEGERLERQVDADRLARLHQRRAAFGASKNQKLGRAQCKTDGFDVTAAVVDRAGDLKVLLRADTANPHNADLARRKAYTARTFKVPSMDVAKRTNGPTDLSGQRYIVDIIPLGGGLPINVGNDTIGALGISGSPTQEGDEKCATAGIAAAASALR